MIVIGMPDTWICSLRSARICVCRMFSYARSVSGGLGGSGSSLALTDAYTSGRPGPGIGNSATSGTHLPSCCRQMVLSATISLTSTARQTVSASTRTRNSVIRSSSSVTRSSTSSSLTIRQPGTSQMKAMPSMVALRLTSDVEWASPRFESRLIRSGSQSGTSLTRDGSCRSIRPTMLSSARSDAP